MDMDTPELSKLDPDLARKLHKALIGSNEELFQLVTDPAPEVLRATLKNKNLNEDHLLALLKRVDLTEDLLKAVYQYEQQNQSRQIKKALVRNPNTPGPITLALLPHLYLFELVDLCFMPGVTPDQKIAAERTIIQRLPEIEIGNKITLSRRATADVVGAILKEGDSRLTSACLNNSRLKEVSVLQFLNSGKAKADTISAIARHSKWKHRPNLKMAMLKNRNTPDVWFTLFLPKLKTGELNNLLVSRRLNPRQKKLVQGELKKRGG
jgi:hypothetical protein